MNRIEDLSSQPTPKREQIELIQEALRETQSTAAELITIYQELIGEEPGLSTRFNIIGGPIMAHMTSRMLEKVLLPENAQDLLPRLEAVIIDSTMHLYLADELIERGERIEAVNEVLDNYNKKRGITNFLQTAYQAECWQRVINAMQQELEQGNNLHGEEYLSMVAQSNGMQYIISNVAALLNEADLISANDKKLHSQIDKLVRIQTDSVFFKLLLDFAKGENNVVFELSPRSKILSLFGASRHLKQYKQDLAQQIELLANSGEVLPNTTIVANAITQATTFVLQHPFTILRKPKRK